MLYLGASLFSHLLSHTDVMVHFGVCLFCVYVKHLDASLYRNFCVCLISEVIVVVTCVL